MLVLSCSFPKIGGGGCCTPFLPQIEESLEYFQKVKRVPPPSHIDSVELRNPASLRSEEMSALVGVPVAPQTLQGLGFRVSGLGFRVEFFLGCEAFRFVGVLVTSR